jgi:hypothetical protein
MSYPKLGAAASLGLLSMLICCVLNTPTRGGLTADASHAAALAGIWSAGVAQSGQTLRLSLKRDGGGGASSAGFPVSQLQGLTHAQLSGDEPAATFRLVREAGTINFEGSFKRNRGAGRWEFEADEAFASALGASGHAASAEDLLALALNDVGLAYVRGMDSAGIAGLTAAQLAALRTNGVTPEDVKGYGRLLEGEVGASQLIALKSNGVTEDYLRSLAEVNVRPTAQQAVAMRTNGLTADFVKRARASGRAASTAEELLRLKLGTSAH